MSNDPENVAFLVDQIKTSKLMLDNGRLNEVDPAIRTGAYSQSRMFDEEGALMPVNDR